MHVDEIHEIYKHEHDCLHFLFIKHSKILLGETPTASRDEEIYKEGKMLFEELRAQSVISQANIQFIIHSEGDN